MTITAYPVRNEYTASAGQTVFDYTFKIYATTDLNVYLTPAGQEPNDSTDLIVAYSVTGVGDEDGGEITLVTPAALNDLITIVGDVPDTRTTNYENNGDFVPDTVNEDFDRVVSLVKQVQDQANRTVLFEDCQQGDKPLSMEYPVAGQGVRWKDDLSGLENVDFLFVTEDVLIPIILDLTGAVVDGTDVIVGTDSSTQIIFKTNNIERWIIESDGDFVPATTKAYDIGAPLNLVQNFYQGDNGYHYFGDSQQANIRCSSNLFYIVNSVNNIYISTTLAYSIFFATNNTNRWIVNSSGHLTPGAATAYNIGQASLPVQHIFSGDGGTHYFGDSQDASIYHTGVTFWIHNITGDIRLRNANGTGNIYFYTDSTIRWYITPTGDLFPFVANTYDIGGSTLGVANIYQGDNCYHYFGNSQDAHIYFNGSTALAIQSAVDIRLIVPSLSSGVISFYTNGTKRWEIITGGSFIPEVTNTYSFGVTTNCIKNIYQGDNCYHYFGDSQDAHIYFNGSDFKFANSVGSFVFENTNASGSIYFKTSSIFRWYFNQYGHFIPSAVDTYDIGSSGAGVRNIYQGDNCYHYFSDSQEGQIHHDGLGLYFETTAGRMQFTVPTAQEFYWYIGGSVKWRMGNTAFYPNTTKFNSLGGVTNLILHIYQGDSCYHYFGDSQDGSIYHSGSSFRFSSTNGNLYIQITDATSTIYFQTNSINRWRIDASGLLLPNATNSYDIGTASLQVRDIYLQNAPTVSDIRLKNNIEPSILGLDFINSLNPVSYKYNDTPNDRKRYGLIAQEVKAVLDVTGLEYDDFCGVRYHDKEDIWSLDYKHFIAPLIKAVQEQNNRINELEEKLCQTLH